MTSRPLVSCIMPTRNRRRFLRQSINYFLRQDYAARELVIVDDGADKIADLVPNDPRIRYLPLPSPLPLGAKRNLACAESRGDLIAHWDDDGWMAPNRLSLQVEQLLTADADVCGARELLHYSPHAGAVWLYRYPQDGCPWLAGGTLLYRKSAWLAHPFPEQISGESVAFLWQFDPARVHALSDSSPCVAILHRENVCAPNRADPRWEQRTMADIGPLLASDSGFYAALRNGNSGLPSCQSAPASSITLVAPFMVYDGYGSMAEYLALGMSRAGAALHIAPIHLDLNGMSPEFQNLARRSRPAPDAPVLYFCWPRPELEPYLGSELCINTMWESSRLPTGWAESLNRARVVIVPTRFCAQVFRASGVTVPLEVIPEGVAPEVYPYLERPERAGLTTLIVGTVGTRKNVQEGVAAWKQAFAGDPDARLVIKARFHLANFVPDDPRIRFVDTTETTRGILHWYREADVLLALGNEGFGLPMVEAMATGLPVIALRSEGQGDVCAAAATCLLPISPARFEPYHQAGLSPAGVRGIPDVAVVADRLRWVARNRQEARAMGRGASQWVHRHRNIWEKGPAVLDVMERALRPARPFRRRETFWVPSWKQACGIAEYTADLAGWLPMAHTSATLPDLAHTRLLHIQHENSLFQDGALQLAIHNARQAGVPVVATLHTVMAAGPAWEGDIEALVALTSRGTGMLRARWPAQRVEHIPLGCPTWRFPRKPKRGRTIGAFGFLHPHKGFWKLLEVLREIPDTELLLFSHAKHAAEEAAWIKAAEGLPVRRIRDYVPVEEAARRLAAEADILAFWYDEYPHASASAAVRVGLATGVPVLASPTGWFAELSEVTYQPDSLAEGVQRLLDDTPLRTGLADAARDYCERHGYSRIAERHLALWHSLESQ